MAAKSPSRIKSGREEDLYFIAIIPDEPLKSRVTVIKKQLEAKYKTRAALRSPPHITLHMPFRWQAARVNRLSTVLEELSGQITPFLIELNGFEAFPPRVIFLKVAENEVLNNLKKQISKVSLQQWKLFERVDTRPFHPHITIVFRDLNKTRFAQAWAEVKDQEFNDRFVAGRLTLLKHNGKFWEEHLGFPFAG